MCSYLNKVPQLKPKLNNAETKKPFHEFSFIVKKAGATAVTTITSLIVSITKFLIMIGSPRAYSSRNRRGIMWVSNYRCPI